MEDIFFKQREFQEMLGADIKSQEFKNQMFYALIAEVVEAGNETPWKPWKKNQSFDKNKFVEELADIQIFLLNLVLSSGSTWPEFVQEIRRKQSININRQRGGY